MKKLYIFLASVLILSFAGRYLFAQEAPYLPPISDQKVLVDTDFTLDIDASFADPQEYYELTQAPAGMIINQFTGVIEWTPTDLYQGGPVTVRAYNTVGDDTRTFLVFVADAVPCSDDLVSYYNLDETSGNIYLDKKSGHNAMAVSSVSSTEGMIENGQLFQPSAKSTKFLQVANNSDHNWLREDSFSFSFWFKYGGPNGFNTVQALISKGRLGAGQSFIQVYLDDLDEANETILFQVKDTQYGDPPYPYVEKSVNLIEDAWYHIAAVYRGAEAGTAPRMSLYVNNSKLSYLAPVMANGDIISSSPLDIGCWSEFSSNGYPFAGAMDELLIYKKALSDADVATIFQEGIDGEAHCPKPGNVVPLVSSASADTATQDEIYTYSLVAEDYEDESVTLALDGDLPAWLNFNAGSGLLTGTPTNENTEDVTVNFTVSDGTFDVPHALNIHVINANDPPEITNSPAVTTVAEDTEFIFTIEATDLDEGDVITFSSRNLPGWLSFTPASGVLRGTPTNDQVQYSADSTFAVVLFATDLEGAQDSLKFDLTVTNVNDPAVVVSQSDVSTDRNVPVEISLADLTVTDVDDRFPAEHSLTVLEGDDYTFSGTTITPAENFYGELTVNVEVMDSEDTTPYEFTITVDFLNIAPEFTSSPKTEIEEDRAYVYVLEASDPDVADPAQNQTLTYSAVGDLPSWLELDAAGRTLSGIPDREDVGEHPVVLMVSDGDLSDTQEFTITVSSNNRPPIIASSPQLQIGNYLKYSYTVVAADPDSDDLTYSAQLLPRWLSFDPETHILEGIPEKSDVGNHDVILKVTDGFDEAVQEFTIEVLNINSQPVVISDPPDTVMVNVLYTYQLVAIDYENDPLTVIGTVIPTWMNFDAQTRVLSGTPTGDNIGSHNVTLTVSDGAFIVQQQFVIEVVSGTGVEDQLASFTSSIYPNPASEYIFFELNDNVQDNCDIEISDITGKVVLKDVIYEGTSKYRVDVSAFRKGIYLYRIFTNDKYQTGKILIK